MNSKESANCGSAEEKLKQSEARNHAWLENSPVCTKIVDCDFNLQFMSYAGVKALQIDDVTTLYGKPYPFDFYPDSFKIPMRENLQKATDTGEVITQEASVVDVKGNELWFHSTIVPVNDDKGELDYLMVVSLETTARKRAELELIGLRNYLSNIIDSMPSMLIGVDQNYKVTQWNSEAEKQTGISAAGAVGNELHILIPRLTDKIGLIKKAIQSREVQVESKQPYIIEGLVKYEDLTVFPLISNKVQGAVIRIDDITERVKIEEVMIQSEKMQSIGGLASGMAHEINNPLGGIMQGYQNIQNRIDPERPKNQEAAAKYNLNLRDMYDYLTDRKIIAFLNGGHNACKRAAQIVRNMLMFSRKPDSELSAVNIAELVDHSIELGSTDYDMKKKYDFKFVDIVKEYAPDLPEINCCASEIEQVLLNIFKNAIQAMEVIETEGYKPQFHIRLLKEPEHVRIEVEDNGPGIPEDIRKRIFEPFFTTKPVGIGTGLGLSVSYMIVTQNHGGTFEVVSEMGKFTRFIIRLPI